MKTAAGVGGPGLAVGFRASHLRLGDSFHTGVAGEADRSAQPTASDIRRGRFDDGIATIINLRGAAPGQRWCDDHVAAARAAGIKQTDVPMRAGDMLGPCSLAN